MTDSCDRPQSEKSAEATEVTVGAAVGAPKTLTTDKLFEGQKELFIEHAGERYRLRITRRNKLILQK
jgi:hemin uptake protein HemP